VNKQIIYRHKSIVSFLTSFRVS